MSPAETLRNRIIELREQRHWSQAELAKRMKMDSSYISKIESGNRKVSSAELDSFANIFDVSADYLLGRGKTDAKDPQNDLSRNQKLVAYSIDPDISDEERQAIIEMVQAAKKFRRRI